MLSKNVTNIEISGIRQFYNKVSKYSNAISLTLGEPDFIMPKEIKEAMKEAIDKNLTKYTPNSGINELRDEISIYLETMDVYYEKDEICVTVGGSEGLFSTFMSILNSGDKVLVPTIAYPAYENCIKMLNGQVINYELKDDFSINLENLKEMIKNEKPKAIVFSYPSNPTGAIMDKNQREELHDILIDEDILIISDEVYSSIVFEEYNSLCQCRDLKNKSILIGGFSKMFSMTGIRIGYVCAPLEILNNIIKVHQYNVSCATSIGQYGALKGLKESLCHIDEMKTSLMERRDYVYNRLIHMGLEVNKPKGAFYIFPNIKKYNMTSEEFCERLLEEKKVALVPGSAFGYGGEGYARISYCYSMKDLELALDKLEEWINDIRICL